jgi:hypothetical protein
MNRFKNWLISTGIVIAGLFGIHYNLPETSTIEVVTTSTPSPIVSPVIQNKRIEISCDESCTQAEKDSLPALVAKLIDIEDGECFNEYLLDPKNGLDTEQLNGLTPVQAINVVTNAQVHTTLSYFYRPRNWFTKVIVVGEERGDDKVYANRAAWEFLPICDKISNLAHEISHQNGFSHDFSNTSKRPYSMPYEINQAIDACCKQ